jgi:hypothetical protein
VNEKPSDDLTAIKGIGPVWQRRLRESLGVRTFRDLAALSCDEILSRLEASGQIAPSKADCEAWINQAQELAAATGSSTKRSEWKPFASFVVEYLGRITEGKTDQRRTKVHHLETDTDANWPSIVSVELCRWMLEQTDEIAPSEVEKLIEAYRAQAQSELEQELKGQRAAAQQQLQQALKEEQTSARQVLQQELDDQRAQAQKEQEQASKLKKPYSRSWIKLATSPSRICNNRSRNSVTRLSKPYSKTWRKLATRRSKICNDSSKNKVRRLSKPYSRNWSKCAARPNKNYNNSFRNSVTRLSKLCRKS